VNGSMRLVADDSGALWAEYDVSPGVLAQGQMVAGAGFEPATFGL
jgi:hypothetical protein